MASKTITVACKLPAGLNLGDGPNGRAVILNGARHSTNAVAGGYGLTSGVDAEWFGKWLEDHKDLPAVKKGLIFANERRDFVQAQGTEQAAVKSGFEGLDPEKPAPGVEETAESKKARLAKKNEAPEDINARG